MPKRLLDDSFLNSPSMAVLSPRAQDAFLRFMLLADDFGCFEVHPRQLVAKGWPDRQDVSEADIAAWLDEYASKAPAGEPPAAMLWEERGRRWCFLTGWNGPHGQRKRIEYDPTKAGGEKGSKRRTPRPPAELLAAITSGQRRTTDGKPPGTDLLPAAGDPNFPGGNPPGTGIAKPNDSVPGREITGKVGVANREIPFPAAAVPVAVPVVVAVPPPSAEASSAVPAAPPAPPPALTPVAAATPALKPQRTAAAESDPRKAEKRAAFERIFRALRHGEYRWQGAKDAVVVRDLVAVPLEEWEHRITVGLTTTDYQRRISTVAQLGMKWNDLAGTGPPNGAQKLRAIAAAEPHENFTTRKVTIP